MADFLQDVETAKSHEILSDCREDGTDRDWKGRKINSLKLSSVYDDLAYKNVAERVGYCADVLKFRQTKEGRLKLYQTWFCKNKLCPMCNWRRALKHSYQAGLIIDKALEKYPKARFIFLTLTVQNVVGEELSATLSSLTKSFDRLFKRVRVKKNLLGYLRSVEVTRNSETGEYHPHIHVLMMVRSSYFNKGDYINQKEWSKLWSESLKVDYTPVVNVKVVKPDKNKGLKGAVIEVAKYPVKPIDFDIDSKDVGRFVEDIFLGLYRKRQIGYGGEFKEIKKILELDNVEDGDLVSVSGEQVSTTGIEIIAEWSSQFMNYLIRP